MEECEKIVGCINKLYEKMRKLDQKLYALDMEYKSPVSESCF